MARFRITRSFRQPPHLAFGVEMLSGEVVVGEKFSVWDCRHRYDFAVLEVRPVGASAILLCGSDFLRLLSPDEQWPGLFAGKEVDTEDPSVAQRFSHRGTGGVEQPDP